MESSIKIPPVGEANPEQSARPFRVLSLDGGGAKGFYTLGILDELEKNTGKPIFSSFDLIFGTSTGAIIAALLARGDSVENVLKLYRDHVPLIMKRATPARRSAALSSLAHSIFKDTKVADFKTKIGIVATNWKDERPFIFKSSKEQAHGSKGSFVQFFGCSVADAIIGSCSAYPFFNTYTVKKFNGDSVELADGGFCANNPTLYAIAEAIRALNMEPKDIRVVSLGVGAYPEPSILKRLRRVCSGWGLIRHSFNTGFLQRILGTNTQSMEQLRSILYKDIVPTVRINDAFVEPAMATDLLEHDLTKLDRLVQKGRISYQAKETELLNILTH